MVSNCSKSSATAALDFIHKGYLQEGMNILGPYLPQADGESQSSAYSESGALYVFGFRLQLWSVGGEVPVGGAHDKVVQYEAALGLGIGDNAVRHLLHFAVFRRCPHEQL